MAFYPGCHKGRFFVSNSSPANRQARQERAQAAALKEIEIEADRRREQTNKLRKLRIEREKTSANRFKSYRESRSSSGE